ncbi:hypothetical protein Nepgr_016776 [Nepenthes gracilis]|uniref:Protein PIN-LIKES 7-like n=1 Tax=Nepenthes gracilis TaxID=150966 RepID=A0AAD3SQB9_NEPGR|nr:hypothetical protein Nepgr_016776 [Nepenthes gracilis]
MGFWSLLEVAAMPILEVLIVGGLGAFMATDYCKLLPADARRLLNKMAFLVFIPSLIFSSLAQSVTLQDIISWWFMPVNIGLTFLFGGLIGWIAVKLLKPEPYLEGLIIAICSSGNLGNLVVIIVPAMCLQEGSPFGNQDVCRLVGLSYASFSMALGGFYIWTYSYQLVRSTAIRYKALQAAEQAIKEPLLKGENQENGSIIDLLSESTEVDTESQSVLASSTHKKENETSWSKLLDLIIQVLEELRAPPTLAAVIGLIFGAITWLKMLIIGDNAPLHVIQDSITMLGAGAIPCVTLVLGGNLTQGFRTARLKMSVIIGVICVKYMLLPVIGVGVVKVAENLGFLPPDPLYRFVLMLQFTLPPAMNIGAMTQLFDVGQEECSVLFLWTYLVAAFALTGWSTVFMWIL